MKKIIIALFVFALAITPVFASDPDVSLMGGIGGSIGSQGNAMPTTGAQNEFGITISKSTQVRLNLTAESDVFFDKNNGLYVNAGFYLAGSQVSGKLGAGYALRCPISNSSVDFIFTVGPYLSFARICSFGAYLATDFQWNFHQSWFIRFGMGMNMDIFQFGGNINGVSTEQFYVDFAIPHLAVGYEF